MGGEMRKIMWAILVSVLTRGVRVCHRVTLRVTVMVTKMVRVRVRVILTREQSSFQTFPHL
ncbi:hypothetical protein RHMOL_Rhmol11G0119500 [Rhododendron molle]|uniref:Uncharacterized protein n=2 Tax=Rhododendron molle TaxID=49168 RepID=A0ACC0LSV2_RHOML|nr:hypothetical protein RHMOL_Rhmol11G0119500 [Rhododendron molle]